MQVKLCDRLTHEPITAEVTTLTDCHFADLNSTWPLAFRGRHQLGERDEDSLMWTPSAGSVGHLVHSERLRSFALIAEDKIQGVLLLHVQTQLSRLEPEHALVYVRYLATAPWNRHDKNRPGQIRGVGTLLMAYAVRRSRDEGCGGRLGLHSLRGSDDFYLLLGLENLGLDAARRGMNYFELRSSRAADF
mgnify:CR=1 FL=1